MTCPQPTADTNRVSLYISPEPDDCWGQEPEAGNLAPKGYELRMTGESLAHAKQTVTSNTIRTDRMRDTVSEVAASAEGDINFELSFRDWDLMLQAALANDFEYLIERTIVAGNLQAINSSNRFNVLSGAIDFDNFVVGADFWVDGFEDYSKNNGRFKVLNLGAGGTYVTIDPEATGYTLGDETPPSGAGHVIKTEKGVFTDLEITANNTIASTTTNFLTGLNLAVGQYIRMAGWDAAHNNGVFKIATIAANLLTFEETTLTTETPTTVTLTAKRLKNGVARKSMLVEKRFGDVGEYIYYPGMRVGQMSLAVESQALVTGTFSMMGKEGVGSSTSKLGSVIPAGVKAALNATTNVGQIQEGGASLATALRGITLQVNNNLRSKPQIGSRSPIDIGYGFVDITGTINAYFDSLELYNKFRNHTESELSWRFTDAEGNTFIFTLPRIYFTDGNPTAPGGNDDVMVPLEFTAVRDTDTDSVILIDVIAA